MANWRQPNNIWLTIEQTHCTMARANRLGLPSSLNLAAKSLGITDGKDMGGRRLMLQMCKPRLKAKEDPPTRFEDARWWDSHEKKVGLYKYCIQDVEVEREIHHRTPDPSEEERALWILDQKINERGINLDRASAEKFLVVIQEEVRRLDAEMYQAILSGEKE